MNESDRRNDAAPGHGRKPAWRRRDTLGLLGGAALVGATGLPLGAFAQAAPKRGGILKVSAPANPSSLDPATGGAGTDHAYLWTIYDTLVEWDYATLEPKPGLAEWKFPDPLTMVLTLHPGVKFHDGTPLDAEAVKFNLDRNRQDARSNIKADLASVAEVQASGPLEVRLKLKQPDAALPAILSDRGGMMASPKAVTALGADHDRSPVGAGPWKFVSWADNQSIVVTRNEAYWRPGLPHLDGIEFAIVPERATGLRSVVSGQQNFAYMLSARLKPVVERAKNLQLVTGPTLYCLEMYFNYARAPLDNVKVRQAINYALDRDAFVKATLAGIGEPARMNLPSAHWAYDKSIAGMYPHDPDRARKLLAEGGFSDGLELTVGGYTDQDSVRRAEVVMAQLGKAGIRMKLTNGTIPEISAQFFGSEKKFDSLLSAWTGRPDPSMSYSLMYAKDAYYNAGRAEVSQELSQLLVESRAKEDLDYRRQVFAKIQRIVMEQALVAPLAFQFEMDALAEQVKGYKPDLLGKPKFNDVWLAG
ncbi:MAG: ABC transporter substrate-binding protein [Gammaproteobacteria bacterium]